MKHISLSILAIIFLVSCSDMENDKVTEYKETGHLIKTLEEIDIDTYQQYIKKGVFRIKIFKQNESTAKTKNQNISL